MSSQHSDCSFLYIIISCQVVYYCTFHLVLFPILLQSLRLCLSNLSDSTVLLF